MKYLATLFLIFCYSIIHSQSCGLVDTILFNANSNIDIDLEITDYFNNDLADPDQGLCGVELHFTHQLSKNLEVSLTSPNGQTINLIGPNVSDPTAITFFAQWKINFLPCADTPVPDLGYLAQWNNDQPNNFVAGGLYSGSYHPFNGCLEDFNNGPVNGTWTVNVNNAPSSYAGAFLGIRLYFCDTRGVDCCFAQPGELPQQDITACIGDDTLAFTPILNFPNEQADTSEYSYIWMIANDSTLIAYDSIIDLTSYPIGNYEVCGFSYRTSEIDSLPAIDDNINIHHLFAELNSLTPPFCGLATEDCIDITILPPPTPSYLDTIICSGENIVVADSLLYQTGHYEIITQNDIGCDSTIFVNLEILPSTSGELDTTICLGDTVWIDDMPFFDQGQYEMILSTFQYGCDSLLILTLDVIDPIVKDSTFYICEGESITIADSTITQEGNYSFTLASSLGCDSTINATVDILSVEAIGLVPDSINCTNNGVLLSSNNSSAEYPPTYAWHDLNGNLLSGANTLFINTQDTVILTLQIQQDNTICSSSDTLFVYQNDNYPIASSIDTAQLTCDIQELTLGNLSSSQGSNYTYQWTTDIGNFTSPTNEIQATVSATGTYELMVTDTTNGCSSTAISTAVIDTIAPTITTMATNILDCQLTTTTINSTGSSIGAQYTYEWTSSCLPSPITTPDITTNCPGTYNLQIINNENGCNATQNIIIAIDTTPPNTILNLSNQLSCTDSTATIDASNSIGTGMLSFDWTGTGIITNNNSSIIANQAGEYLITVTDQNNNCFSTSSITIETDTISPIANVGGQQIINCYQDTITLGSNTSSQGQEYTYQWTTSNGAFIGDPTMLFVDTDEPGNYTLVVTDTTNGCQSSDQTFISLDQAQPFANAGNDLVLDCTVDNLTIDGSNSNYPNNAIIEWTSECLTTPISDISFTTDCIGTYHLEITNPTNGCSDQDTVIISENPATVHAILPDSTYIDCFTGEAIIDGSASSQGFYQWWHNGEQAAPPTQSPSVTATGVWTMIISNLTGTCSDTTTTTVYSNCTPEITLNQTPDTINCDQYISTININILPSDANYDIQWIAPEDGCILTENTPTEIEVICGGEYHVIATNTATNYSDTLSINILQDDNLPVADAGLDAIVNCYTPIAFLNGANSSSGSDYTYTWTHFNTNTIISSSQIAQTTSAGIYLLEVTDTTNTCTAVDYIQVEVDTISPNIFIGSQQFSCESDTLTINTLSSPLNPDLTYDWSGIGIVGSNTNDFVQVDQIGNYNLVVTNPVNGCTFEQDFIVTRPVCSPCIELSTLPDTLTCLMPTTTIGIDFCANCNSCTINWTTQDGNIIGSTNTASITVDQAGTYTTTVVDHLGYSSTISVSVYDDILSPMAYAGEDQVITCSSPTITLGNDLIDSTIINYSWTSLNGNTIINANELHAIVNTADTYTLTLENPLTGCSTTDEVIVSIDTIAPIANAGTNQTITCASPYAILEASGSSIGSDFSILWTHDNNGCINGEQNIQAIVECSGTYTLTIEDTTNNCTSTDTVSVNLANTTPNIPTITGGTLNCLTDTIYLVGNTSSIDQTYEWCTFDSTAMQIQCNSDLIQTVTTPGEYTFSIIDTITQCSHDTTITIHLDTIAPLVTLADTTYLSCVENSTLINAQTDILNFTNEWTNSNNEIIETNNLTLTTQSTGTYYLSLTNTDNFCQVIDSTFVINNPNTPTITPLPDSIITCANPTLTITATAASPSNQLFYEWTTMGGSFNTPTNLATVGIEQTGTYYLSVLDINSYCTASDTLIITENTTPPTPIIDSLDHLLLNCIQDTLLLDASPSLSATGAQLSYLWTIIGSGNIIGDNTNDSILISTVGNYQLLVTDNSNGCNSTLPFSIEENFSYPIIEVADISPITCSDTTTTIDATASNTNNSYHIEWLDEDDNILQTGNYSFTTNGETSPIIIALTDSNSQCTSYEDITIPIDTTSPTVHITASATALDCENATIELTATTSTSPTYSFEWQSTDGNIISATDTSTITIDQGGSYEVLTTNDENGCQTITPYVVIQNSIPIEEILMTITQPNCTDTPLGQISIDSIQGGTPPFLISINEQAASYNTNYYNLTPATYTIAIEDHKGCTLYDTINITPPLEATIYLGQDTTINLGDSLQLVAITNLMDYDTIIWTPTESINNNDSLLHVVQPSITTSYQATIVSADGCTATDNIIVYVSTLLEDVLFIPNAFSPNGDGTNDILRIFVGKEVDQINYFSIYDRWGNRVYEITNTSYISPVNSWDGTFNGQTLNPAAFVWIAEVKMINGTTQLLKGSITLVK